MGQRGHGKEQGIRIFSMGKEMKTTNWEQVFFVHRRLVSAVKRIEFVNDRLSYIVLKGH